MSQLDAVGIGGATYLHHQNTFYIKHIMDYVDTWDAFESSFDKANAILMGTGVVISIEQRWEKQDNIVRANYGQIIREFEGKVNAGEIPRVGRDKGGERRLDGGTVRPGETQGRNDQNRPEDGTSGKPNNPVGTPETQAKTRAFDAVSVQEFKEARDKTTRPEFLSVYTDEELGKMRLFKLEGEDAGYAIKEDGDIVNVFNNTKHPSLGILGVMQAVMEGGTKLDCYDGHLAKIYKRAGFRETENFPWDEQYAPKNWNYEKYGTPDVVMLEYKGGNDFVDIIRGYEVAGDGEGMALDATGRALLDRLYDRFGEQERQGVGDREPTSASGRVRVDTEGNLGKVRTFSITPEAYNTAVAESTMDGKKKYTGGRQKLIITMGLPGAGKSTGLQSFSPEDRGNFVFVNPDIEAVKIGGDRAAAQKEASAAATQLLRTATAAGHDTVYDTQGTNFEEIDRAIQTVLANNGRVVIYHVDTTPEISRTNSDIRYEAGVEDREVPDHVIVMGHRRVVPTFIEILKKYANNKNVEITLYSNNVTGGHPTLVIDKGQIVDQESYNKLRNTPYILGEENRYERTTHIKASDFTRGKETGQDRTRQNPRVIIKSIPEPRKSALRGRTVGEAEAEIDARGNTEDKRQRILAFQSAQEDAGQNWLPEDQALVEKLWDQQYILHVTTTEAAVRVINKPA